MIRTTPLVLQQQFDQAFVVFWIAAAELHMLCRAQAAVNQVGQPCQCTCRPDTCTSFMKLHSVLCVLPPDHAFIKCCSSQVRVCQSAQAHHLLNNGAAVNQRDSQGWTPLHRAAHLAHLDDYLEIYEYLLVGGFFVCLTGRQASCTLHFWGRQHSRPTSSFPVQHWRMHMSHMIHQALCSAP
jgi:hypothetical protein